MRRALVAALVLFVSAFRAPAASPHPVSPDARAEREPAGRPAATILPVWNDFAARRGGSLAVTWNPGAGTPRSIFGDISDASGPASEKRARGFLAENASLFGMSEGTRDLTLARGFESGIGRHFVFQQTYRDLPVFGAEVGVHFDGSGRVVAVSNRYEPGIERVAARSRVSADEALALARAVLPERDEDSGDNGAPSAELGIHVGERGAALAWKVTIPTLGPTWEVFVNAETGRPLAAPVDVNRYVDGTGQVFLVNAVVATHDNTLRDDKDAASAVPASAYSIVTLPALAGTGYLEGTFASSAGTKKRAFSTTNTFLFDRSEDGFSETMGYYYLDYAQRYIQSLGFTNVNNRRQDFNVNRFKKDNSFYSSSTKDITYGTGGVDDAEDAEVIWHEYGHSIQDNQVPGFGGTLESGSMGEGFGDYWAGSLGAQLSGGFQDLCIADWDSTSYSTSDPPCLRRLDSSKHYPEDVSGEVHADGEMWSAALWQIRSALGATKADRLVLQAHFLLSTTPTFSDGSNALVTAAGALGYTPAEVDAVRTILRNRGFTVTS